MGLDLGLLIVRLALGPMLVLHGYNKIFGAGGLTGTTRWFHSLGLRPAAAHARIAAVSEIGAGLLLTLGLGTPLACTAFVGLMVTATLTDHRGKGYFVFRGGWEYAVLVAMVAVGLAATGPGAWSLDGVIGRDLAGPWWALGAALLGTAAAGLLLALSYRPQPSDDDLAAPISS